MTPRYSCLIFTRGHHLTRTGPNAWLYALGDVSVLDAPIVEESFLCRNETAVPITIDRVASTCGCVQGSLFTVPVPTGKPGAASKTADATMAPIATGAAISLPAVAPPGGQVAVRVRVNLEVARLGPVEQTLSLFGAAPAAPLVTVRVCGVSLPPSRFLPAVLDFGNLRSGALQPRRLVVEYDPRLVRDGRMPMLTPSTPAIDVLSQMREEAAPPLPAPHAVSPASPTPRSASQPAPLQATYLVLVKPTANLGPLAGALKFTFAPVPAHGARARSPSRDTNAPLPAPALQYFWQAASEPVTGTVLGDISADPSALHFILPGTVGSRTKTFVVTEESPQGLDGMQLIARDVWLTATVSAPAEAHDGDPSLPAAGHGAVPIPASAVALDPSALPRRTCRVRVSVAAGGARGHLKSSVALQLANGQRLIVPVEVDTPPGAAPKRSSPF